MDSTDEAGPAPSTERTQPADASSDDMSQLFHLYYGPVYSFFLKRGFPVEECRDLTQETFIRVLKYRDQLRSESSVGHWILRIAANVWKNELRWWSAEKRDAAEISLDQQTEDRSPVPGDRLRSPRPGALETLLSREQSELLRQAVDRLPPQMRRCLRLRIDQEMKYREIAAVMQLNVNTVKSQVSQGQQRLKAELEKLKCRES